MPKLQKFYLLAGPDTFRKKLYLDSLKEDARNQRIELEWHIFYPAESRIREILDFARTFSLFKKQRVIVLRNAELSSAPDKKTLLGYIARRNLPPLTTLIIESFDYPDADNFHRQLSGYCVTKVFKPLRGREVEGWLNGLLRARHKKITHQAAGLLTESFGRDLAGLYNTVNNLTIYT